MKPLDIATAFILFLTALISAFQWSEARRATEAATRAWVGPTHAAIDRSDNPHPGIVIDYSNSGKEPAIDFSFETSGTDSWGATITSGRPKDSIFNIASECAADNAGSCDSRIRKGVASCKAKQIERNEAVFPGSTYTFREPFNAEKPADISGPDRAIFFQGCFVYRSGVTKDEAHHNAFCYFYRFGMNREPQMIPCPAAGYAD